ncbi:MAG: glycosyltransferase family 9 protein [Verrucomicrobiota bacterium]
MSLDTLQLSSLKSILIVKPSSLGDIVHTLPVLAILRQHAPKARIEWVANTVWAPLLRNHPLLDGLVEFPRDQFRGLAGMVAMAKWAHGQGDRKPELALDVQGLLRSAMIGRGSKPGILVGYSDAREGANLLHDAVVDVSAKRSPHAVERYLTFFTQLGIEIPAQIEFPLPEGDLPEYFPNLPNRFILLHPFSRGRGKSLTAKQVEMLADRWQDAPVILAGKADVPPLALPESWINVLNKTTLAELIWLLRRASWVVSVDSGPMHLAAAANPNLVSIHTWSDPLKVGPYLDQAYVWKSGQITTMGDYRATHEPGETEETEFPDSGIEGLSEFVLEQC